MGQTPLRVQYTYGEGSSAGVRLDPYKNISTAGAAGTGGDLLPGHYKRQYVENFRRPGWGHSWSYCGGSVVVRFDGHELQVRPVLCGRWLCQGCGVMRAAWLRDNLRRAVVDVPLTEFWTVTMRRREVGAAESFWEIGKAWNRARLRLNRAHGKFEYVWVREPTKAGMAHLHVLSSLEVPHDELASTWLGSTGHSWVVDVDPIASARACDYVTKYAASQAKERPRLIPELGSKLRVFSKSRGVHFRAFRKSGGPGWVQVPMGYREARAWVKEHAAIKQEKSFGAPFVVAEPQVRESSWGRWAVGPGGVQVASCELLQDEESRVFDVSKFGGVW